MIKISNKFLIPFFCIFGVLCILGLYFVSNITSDADTVNIYKDKELVKTVDLSSLDKPQKLDLGGNTVLLEKDGVRMVSADCPDKLCVKQGKISGRGRSIVCLPNRVVIEFEKKEGGADAVSGGR